METMRIRTNGIDVHAERHSSKGEPMLFLHYQGGTTAIWNAVIPAFASEYAVHAMDLRGHGQSDLPESGFEMATMAEDVKGVLDALGIEKAHLVGSSLGADVATCFASRHPQRVLSLVNSEGGLQNVAGPHGMLKETKAEYIVRAGKRAVPEFASHEEYSRQMRESWVPWNDVRAKAVAGYTLRPLANGRFSTKPHKEGNMEIMCDLFEIDMKDWYETITCPVLFLPCELEGDVADKLASIEQFKQTLPWSRTVVIPGTTHCMMFDHHAELVREMRAFYEELQREEKTPLR